jgi:hypothetical protein
MKSKISKEKIKNLSRSAHISVWGGRRRSSMFQTNDSLTNLEIQGAYSDNIYQMKYKIYKGKIKNLPRSVQISVRGVGGVSESKGKIKTPLIKINSHPVNFHICVGETWHKKLGIINETYV